MTAAEPVGKDGWVWRREGAMVLLLTLIVFVGYFWRISAMSMRGEEPRRAQVAVELIESGDWVVPREQGELFMSRPPLQNWLIGLCYVATGERDVFGARLPSAIATLFMVFIVYGYARTFLTRTGALAAAAAFATFGEVLQECSTAETEAVFTLFVSGSLLVWHWGMVRGWPDALSWSLGYSLMALGMLAKSLQAPFYFLVSVTVFLALTQQWRRLFSLSHLVGMAAGALVLAAWVIPFADQLGIDAVRHIWMNDVEGRLIAWDGVLLHLVQFPAELLGCTLPWSPLLFAFCRREFRDSIGAARPQVGFMAVVLVCGVPTCWLPPHGMTRYLLPLYPCFAVLVGFVVQRCDEAAPESVLGRGWRNSLLFYTGVMVLVGLALPLIGWFRDYPAIGVWVESAPLAAAFCALFLGLAWLAGKTALNPAFPWRTGTAVTTVALFMVLMFAGPVTNSRIRRGNDVGAEIAKLKAELPAGVQLVSLGDIPAELPFFMQQRVARFLWRDAETADIPERGYFCFYAFRRERPTLPFAWREFKAISVDRNRRAEPDSVLVIAQRVSSERDARERR